MESTEEKTLIGSFKKQENGYYTSGNFSSIRFKIDCKEDLFCFEVLQRPYFFNLIGFKKWQKSIDTNCFLTGLSFSKHLLKI